MVPFSHNIIIITGLGWLQLCLIKQMGRTISSFRIALAMEKEELCGGSIEKRASLVRIAPPSINNEIENKEKWAGSELNQRPPPCQGGILTRLDHRPNIQ